MRSPIQVTHAVALTKRVTVHEKYANDMEDVASIFVRLLTRVGRGRRVLQDAQRMTRESSTRPEPRFLYVYTGA